MLFAADEGYDVSVEDTVQVTVIKMEFVVPDETYNNGEKPDAPAVATDFVGVSDPRPTIKRLSFYSCLRVPFI